MSAAVASPSAMFDERIDPGRIASYLLAAAVHLLLFAILVFGVRWQNRPPEVVEVELWNEPVAAPVAVEPKPAPAPEPLVVKPEPVIPKPDIAIKEPVKAEPVKPRQVPKPVAKPEAVKPKVDETKKRLNELLAREQASLALDREHQQFREQLAREATAASNKALATWIDRIKIKIRNNIVLPQGIQGNPEAIFNVVQLPTGEILSVKLRKSSGVPALDNAIERAVLKSSPLPKPDGGVAAPREFELKYKPLD